VGESQRALQQREQEFQENTDKQKKENRRREKELEQERKGTLAIFTFVLSLPQSGQSTKLSFESSELGLLRSLTCRRVCIPPIGFVGRARHNRLRERGGRGFQFQREDRHRSTLGIDVLCYQREWKRSI
jgi:hypothetical protein